VAGRVIVVGLGPGDPGLVSRAALDAFAVHPQRFVRTRRHPSAHLAEPATSFDELYEQAGSMDEVYSGIVERLVDAARQQVVVYAVPGSPYVAERTVDLLRRDGRARVEIVASLSFLDLAWDRVGVDPVVAGVRLIDGHRFEEMAAGRTGPFLVSQCDTKMVLSAIKLAVDDGPAVTVLQRLGLPDEQVTPRAWADLDRDTEPDHLTSIYIPALSRPVAGEVQRLVELVRDLRARCPWDREQTHASLARHLVEETYEVLDAIAELDRGGGYDQLEEELGDLLFQVAFHAVLAAEAGEFELADVARAVHDKLVDRHPHLYGPAGSEVPNWEEAKRAEKGRESVMDGLPGGLPSLLHAWKIQSKAASMGFDWKRAEEVWPKVDEELAELRRAVTDEERADELGDVLFTVVNLARHLSVDPELALRAAATKFETRFRAMERLARRRRAAIDDSLWEEVKGTSHKR
jgi:tetrapyrrole methylase family protein/MazG family protein